MTFDSSRFWPRSEFAGRRSNRAVTIGVLLLCLGITSEASAQSAACNRAQAIVDEVSTLYRSAQPDHRAILAKLKTAQQLCPTLGEAWKFAYCSALALGDEANARMFKGRAAFNNVTDLECGGAPAAAKTPLPTYVRQKFALVIGIGMFRDPAVPQLKYAAKDARDFAAALTQHANFSTEHVTVLTDEKATRAAILNALQSLFIRAQEDDLVVIYVSSHGSPSAQDKGLGGIGHIVTYDTALRNIWVDAIEYQDFAEKTSLIRARRKVAFLDTCFSGQASRAGEKALSIEGIGVDDRTAKMFLSGDGTFVITSSKATERSWESEKIENSYFTFYLVDAMRRSKEPPTVKEIFDYISTKVPSAVAQEKQAPQHPQMHPLTVPADVRIGVIPKGVGGDS
jgi:hypothetical protein